MSFPNAANLPEGAVFQGRYRILRCLKAGGMGAVYECEHLSTQKRRALKVMLPAVVAAPGARERFELEARVTSRVESEHIVETFDAGVDPESGAPFLVMELLRGEDLDAILGAHGPFPPAEAVVILSQIALALDKTHAAGIVHRDLKPQNLFLSTRDDGSPRVKILDFGIAKVVADTNKTVQQTAAIGTPIYMSPEQMTGDGSIGPASDLFALGHIAYALLSGGPYWTEEYLALPMYTFMSRVLAGATEPPSLRAARQGVAFAPGFDAWFMRATARAPAYRFERASVQIAELAAVLGTPAPRQLPLAPLPMSERLSAPRAPAVPATPAGPLAAPAQSAAAVASGGQAVVTGPGTAGTVGRPLTEGVSPPPASRAPLYAAAALGLLLLAGGGAAAVRATTSHPATPPVSPSVAVTNVAAEAAPSPVSPGPEVIPAPIADPSPIATADAGATTPAPATAKPSAPPGLAGKAAGGKVPDAKVAIDGAKPPSAGAKSCDPPYSVDAAGRHHMKPECL